MTLYQYPDLYAAIRAPQDELLAGVRAALRRHLPRLASLMDPACGPANWLFPFAQDGVFVAGNDLSDEMVATARATLEGYPSEIVQGDMRDLRFTTGPFDAALEVAGTASQLEPADLEAHLHSVARHLRPGGVFLLTLFFETEIQAGATPTLHQPAVVYSAGPVPVTSGGTAWVKYEVVNWNPVRRSEDLRRTVRTQGVPNVPPVLEDHYSLRIWSLAEAEALIRSVGAFDILETDGVPSEDDKGERTVVMRRR